MAGGGKIRFWRGFFRQGCCGQAGHPVRRGPVRLHFGKVDRAGPPSRTPVRRSSRLRSCGGGRQGRAASPDKARWGGGRLRGNPSRASSDRMAARRAVPVATQEATGIDSRDATGWRPAGALWTSPGSAVPLAVRGAGTLPPKGIPGRYALRGRPARWAKPMRAWVSLAAVKSAWCRPGRGASSTTSMPTMLRPCRQRSMSSRA